MQWSKKEIKEQADKYGFIKDTFEKELRLIEVLDRFEKDEFLQGKLALKGGTCLNLFYLDGPRLSVDIDLDYVGKMSRDDMLKERVLIREHVQEIAEDLGYERDDESKRYHALESEVLSYINNGGGKDNIKIEINYMDRQHVLPLQKRKINVPWYGKEISTLCVNDLEIYASKIAAFTNRYTARDLYDLGNLFDRYNGDAKNIEMVRKCAIFYRAIGSKEIPREIDYDMLDKLLIKPRGLENILRKGEYFNAYKGYEKVQDFVTDTFRLNTDEKFFLDNFENGRYNPELLFKGEQLERIENHPMAMYKMKMYIIRELDKEARQEKYKRGKDRGRDGPELGD